MEQNVLNTDLTGKVAVVTGASGTLCSIFAKRWPGRAQKSPCWPQYGEAQGSGREIEAEGGIARGYTCNVMEQGQPACRWRRT